MKYIYTSLLIVCSAFFSFGQNLIINPGFESTTLGSGCYTNQSAASVTAGLDNVTAFYGGTSDGIDIGVSAACYSGGSNSGAVHVVLAGLTGANMFESISFDLNSSIVIGQTYNLSFYAANSNNVNPESLKVGVSNSATSFGTLLSTVSLGTSSSYVQYSTSFTATASGMYLTIEPGALGDFWFGLDDFELSLVSPPCTTPPTAVCQNIDVYLDGAGNATITPSELDGGSVDNCGTPGLTFTASQTVFTCADIVSGGSPADALIITGVMDGPLPGGLPKTIEMYVASAISDLSLYGISSANNGGGSTVTPEYTFPADALTAGQFIYISTDSVNFNAWFGFDPNYTNGMASINGDDAIELFYNGNIVDVFGDVNVDGSGEPWDYLDGWAYRNDLTGPDGSVFALGNWSFSGINVLDGETTNASAATPFPVGTYVSGGLGTSVVLTVTDGDLNTANCFATVTVLDTISPTASQPASMAVECIGDIPAVDPLIITDEADNCTLLPTVTHVGDVSNGLSCPETITRTYSVTDDSGNSTTLEQVFVVNDVTIPTASNPVTINVECTADIPAADILVVTDEADNCTAAPTVSFVSDVSDGASCPETITRTYDVTDDCGNAIQVVQLIVVNDVTAPALGGSLSDFGSSCEVTLAAIGAPVATDNCSGSITGTPDVAFPISAAGTTTVTWTFTDVCGNQATQTQDVVISPMDVSTTLAGLTITAANTSATYQWIDCTTNNAIAGETGVSYTATVNGSYAVVLTENGCSDTSACTVIDNVGIDGLNYETLSLYPNPTANGMFSINIEGAIKEIELIDMMGRIVQVETNLTDKTVNASKLESGKYIVQIKSTDDRNLQGTIVIQ